MLKAFFDFRSRQTRSVPKTDLHQNFGDFFRYYFASRHKRKGRLMHFAMHNFHQIPEPTVKVGAAPCGFSIFLNALFDSWSRTLIWRSQNIQRICNIILADFFLQIASQENALVGLWNAVRYFDDILSSNNIQILCRVKTSSLSGEINNQTILHVLSLYLFISVAIMSIL